MADSSHCSYPTVEELGALLPGYRFDSILSCGVRGTVYSGRQGSLDRPVAVRLCSPEATSIPGFRESLERSAKALARVNNSHVVNVFDFGLLQETWLYVITEWIDGGSLSDSLQGEPVDPAQAVQIVREICEGLEQGRAAGIVHGNLTPESVLLDLEAHPKVTNFGLFDLSVGETNVFAAPECVEGGEPDERVDVFSAGVLLYELLTGKLPEELPAPAPSTLAGSPTVLDDVVRRATDPLPRNRYEDAGDFGDALDSALAFVTANEPGRLVSLPDTAGSPQPELAFPPSEVKTGTSAPRQSGRSAFSVGSLLPFLKLGAVLLVLGVIGYFGKPYVERFLAARDSEDAGSTPIGAEVSEPEPTPLKEVAVAETKPGVLVETVLADLERLKSQLANGERNQFPAGTLDRGESHFLVVRHSLNWDEASKFAENHGAHLAVLPSGKDIGWFSQQLREEGEEGEVWLGAGATFEGKWVWVDGSGWDSRIKVKGENGPGRRATLAATDGETPAVLLASDRETAFGFVLQWRASGENPGGLSAQLARTARDLERGELANGGYPIGTVLHANSRYLLLDRELSWEDAGRLAKTAGGHLVVPATVEEWTWIEETYGHHGNLWLGGYKPNPGKPWQWLTQEPWSVDKWLPGEPADSPDATRLLLGQSDSGGSLTIGCAASDGSAVESGGLLIEWSAPTPVAPGEFDLDRWLLGVNRKIKMMVAPEIKTHEEARAKILGDYDRAMKKLLRSGKFTQFGGRGFGGGRAFGGRTNRVLEEALDEHLDEVKSAGAIVDQPERMPQEFGAIQTSSGEALANLDATFDEALVKHRDFYVKGLGEKVGEIFVRGFTDEASQLKSIIESASEVEAFLAMIDLQE